MSKYGPDDVFMLVGGYDVQPVLSDAEESVEMPVEDTRPLGGTWDQFTPIGTKMHSFGHKGWFDDDADQSNDALIGLSGTPRVLVWGMYGNVIGRACTITAGALQTKYQRLAQKNALTRANAEYSMTGIRYDNALILHALGAETADGDTSASSVDGGAGTSSGAVAALAVSPTDFDLDGYDDITVKVQDAPDNSTWADLIAFTDVGAAPAAELKTVSGNVDRYLSAAWEYNGTGTAPSVTFIVACERTPDPA